MRGELRGQLRDRIGRHHWETFCCGQHGGHETSGEQPNADGTTKNRKSSHRRELPRRLATWRGQRNRGSASALQKHERDDLAIRRTTRTHGSFPKLKGGKLYGGHCAATSRPGHPCRSLPSIGSSTLRHRRL